MLYFPQMSTGCLAQLPLKKSWLTRVIRNAALDGGQTIHADAPAKMRSWNLKYLGLTAAEIESLRSLFSQCEGSFGSFTFFDPAGNLLARSEEFGSAPWQAGAGVTMAGSVSDPVGTTRATRVTNTSAAAASLQQSAVIPGDYQLCFSVWARSVSGVTVNCRRSAGSSSIAVPFATGTEWKRFEFSGRLSGGAAPTITALEIPAGAAVELWAAQLEGQIEASAYRRTYGSSGVRENARFDQDELVVTAEGMESFGTSLRIVSREEN